VSVGAPDPEPAGVEISARGRLHLVPAHDHPAHDHEWQLVSVDYDDGLEVRHFECADCGDVLFR